MNQIKQMQKYSLMDYLIIIYSFSGSLDPSVDDPIRINIPNDDTSKEVWNKILFMK